MYFVYVIRQAGNIGPHEILKVNDQPEKGFLTEKNADHWLNKKIENREGYYFDRAGYHFVILKTYISKNAKWLEEKYGK